MKLDRLVAALAAIPLLAGGLTALAPVQEAPAATSVAARSSASWPCNVGSAVYCANKTYAKALSEAIKWSDAHQDRHTRKPVPYPSAVLQHSYDDRQGMVYVVLYEKQTTGPKKALQVYKYGITSVLPWQDRANDGVRECNSGYWQGGPNPLIVKGSCRKDWVATVQKHDGAWWERYLEASMIKRYELAKHHCPPRQYNSCK